MNQNINTTRRLFLAGTLWPVVSGFLQEDSGRIKRWLEAIYSTEPATPPPIKPDPASWDPEGLTAAWIGHSTVLMNFFGTVILTDPVFSDRVGLNVGGLFTLGPKRLVAPAIPIVALPRVDLILISHGHMDHCDVTTLKELPREATVIMPRNTTSIIEGLEFRKVIELDWTEQADVEGVSVEALPVEHKGSRYPWTEGRPGSNAYLLTKNNTSVVVAGDTAYQEYFKDLPQRGIRVSLAILPIGGYIPHHDNHCTPEEAVMMADHMRAEHILPIHWGTFPGEEKPDDPINRFRTALSSEPERIALEQIGQTWKSRSGD